MVALRALTPEVFTRERFPINVSCASGMPSPSTSLEAETNSYLHPSPVLYCVDEMFPAKSPATRYVLYEEDEILRSHSDVPVTLEI